MSLEENKSIARLALDGIWRDDRATFEDHPGFAETRLIVPLVLTAFPDAAFSVQRQIAEGDMVATFGLVRGTHRGTYMGIPPTGKSFTCQFLALNRIAGGKVVEHNSEVGWLSVFRQLGVLPIIPLTTDRPPRPDSVSGPSDRGSDRADR